MALNRRIFLFILLTVSCSSYGIDIGALTYNLEYEKGFMTKTVINNSEQNKIYRIKVYEINRPGKKEQQVNPDSRDLLFNPKQFILHPYGKKLVKFYINGNGAQERYYRVDFTEIPAPTSSSSSIKMHMVIKLSSILVVSPKNKQLNYQLDFTDKSITNTGNSYFEVIIKEKCDSSDMESEAKYIIPGEKYTSKKILKNTPIVIIYDKRFNYINGNCN